MAEWWSALSPMEQVFALTAIPATLILILQTILLLFGLGGGLHDDPFAHDISGEHDHYDSAPVDHGLRMFTVRGLVAFFSIFGWSGLACMRSGLGIPLSLFISVVAGFLSMLTIALIIKASLRLQVNGTVDLANAVGKTATVYMRVPSGRSERGKVNLMVQERYIEVYAITDEDSDLLPGGEVVVVGMSNPNTLLVTAKKK